MLYKSLAALSAGHQPIRGGVPPEMPLVDGQPQSMMTSFHVAERASMVHINGGISHSVLAESRFLLHSC